MNTDSIKIFIDRLKVEGDFKEKGTLNPSILELDPKDAVASDISFDLTAYLVEEQLIITFSASCNISMPCKICNEFSDEKISITKSTQDIELSDVKKGVYDASNLIRENILLQIPPFHECNGNCKERSNLTNYFKKQDSKVTNNPFSQL
jgi:uncharacterized metal-binding protein YceD (DUF177 family)